MENSTGKANTPGPMGHATRASLLMESGRAKVAGNQPRTMEIFTLVHTRLIRKMDTEGMSGPMAVSTKEALQTMSSTERED